jgi:hypothetical protein
VSWIDVRVVPEPDGRARFELEHIAHVEDGVWAEYGPGAVGVGWDMGLLGLAGHLSGTPLVEPGAAASEWQSSAEGHEFSRLSSERWYEASVAAGEDEQAARAAADRTTAAYTA